LKRLLRCVADIKGREKDASSVGAALAILRAISAGSWDNVATELLQVPKIGVATMKKLSDAGVRSVVQLANMELFHIERVLSRNPPFGYDMLRTLADFPLLTLEVSLLGWEQQQQQQQSRNGKGFLALPVLRAVIGYHNKQGIPTWEDKMPWVYFMVEETNGELGFFWRGRIKALEGGKELVFRLDDRLARDQSVVCILSCEEIAGTMVTAEVKGLS
jgi:hypothetical protein